MKDNRGRPKKDPSELAHNTRKRDFIQVEIVGNFAQLVTKARALVAQKRSLEEKREIPIDKISMAAAIRFAVIWFVNNFKAEADDRTT